ncbi:MAG: hypothetical protein ACK5II_11235 [Paracoccus sp. (in: a-proteobacteria)]
MSQEDPINFRAFVERHHKRKGKKAVELPVIPYPKEWKGFCFDVLAAFRESEKKRLNRKKYGWQATRDAIMEDFDDVSGRKIVGRDDRLTKDHLQDWERHGNIPDAPFAFVDRFVRNLDRPKTHSQVTEGIRRAHFERISHGLSEMYQNRSIDRQEVDMLRKEIGKFLLTPKLEKSQFKHIAIRMDDVTGSMIKVTFVYCPFAIDKENPSDFWRSGLFYDGFLIPLPDFTTPDEFETFELGKGLKAGKDYECLLLLFRPEWRGSFMYGYVMAKMKFGFTNMFSKELILVSIEAVEPNLLFSPFGLTISRDPRYYQEKAPPTDLLKFSNNQKHTEFLEKYFNYCYRGYLF